MRLWTWNKRKLLVIRTNPQQWSLRPQKSRRKMYLTWPRKIISWCCWSALRFRKSVSIKMFEYRFQLRQAAAFLHWLFPGDEKDFLDDVESILVLWFRLQFGFDCETRGLGFEPAVPPGRAKIKDLSRGSFDQIFKIMIFQSTLSNRRVCAASVKDFGVRVVCLVTLASKI